MDDSPHRKGIVAQRLAILRKPIVVEGDLPDLERAIRRAGHEGLTTLKHSNSIDRSLMLRQIRCVLIPNTIERPDVDGLVCRSTDNYWSGIAG